MEVFGDNKNHACLCVEADDRKLYFIIMTTATGFALIQAVFFLFHYCRKKMHA